MRRFVTAAIAAVSFGFLASCASMPARGEAALAEKKAEPAFAPQDAGGDWALVSLFKDGVAQAIAPATLSVTEKGAGVYAVSGFSGVNNYSGSLTADGGRITFAPNLATTRMAGPQPAMEFEAMYMELLAHADSWSVSGRELSIVSGKTVANFQKRSLDGTSWKLVGANTGNAIVSQEGNITLSFHGGTAQGFTGINRVRLGCTANEKTRSLSFADGPLTLMAGTEDKAKAERLFLDNIFKTASYSLTGDRLTLYDKNGTTLLNFVKAQ